MSRLEEQLAVLVAQETYAQSFIGRDGSARHRRSLASDVAWVPTGDAMVWAFFRDVREVDGAAVRDREARLEQLFPSGLTLAGKERAVERPSSPRPRSAWCRPRPPAGSPCRSRPLYAVRDDA